MMADRPRQKQMGVALPDELRKQLEDASASNGLSIAEEIRRRLERTFEEDAKPEDRALMEDVLNLAYWVRMQTGHHWHEHPRANEIMRYAVEAAIKRSGGDDEDREFDPTKMPHPQGRPVKSDDPKAIGSGLEAVLR